MRAVRLALPSAALAVAALVSGCADDGTASDTTPTSESSPVDRTESADDAASDGAIETTSATEPSGLPAACDLIAVKDVATAYGVTPKEPALGGGGYAEGDVEWQTDDCNFVADRFLDVDFAIADATDFTGGFTCPKPDAGNGPVSRAKVEGAAQGWWQVTAAEGEPFAAQLRACTADEVLVMIDLEFRDGYQHEGDPMAQSVMLAERVLGRV